MTYQNDDLRIKEINELLPPVALLEKFPATENAANTVAHARAAIHSILRGSDDRLLVGMGLAPSTIQRQPKNTPHVCLLCVKSLKTTWKS